MPIVDILRVGLSGLCFLLAVLAYRLIGKEQERDGLPRKGIFTAIYVFMGINILAATLCAVAGYLSSDTNESGEAYLHTDDYSVDYSSFFVDLTSWTPKTLGPVEIIRTDFIRKERASTKNYVIPYFTTGQSITCEPLTFSTRPIFRKKDAPGLEGLHYDYVLPVGHQPKGYTESVSSKFIFPSGFRNPEKEWWQASVAYPAKAVVVTILFPETKPCKSVVVSSIDGIKAPEEIRNNPAIIRQAGKIVSWVGLNEAGKSRIQFDWDW